MFFKVIMVKMIITHVDMSGLRADLHLLLLELLLVMKLA